MSAIAGIILVMEDNPDDAHLVEIAFEKAKVANPIFIVQDGHEAIAYLSGKGKYADRSTYPRPVLVILDINVPGFSGHAVLKWMRRQSEWERTPTMMLTGSREEVDVTLAMDSGADGYLLKPPSIITIRDLASRLGLATMATSVPKGSESRQSLRP